MPPARVVPTLCYSLSKTLYLIRVHVHYGLAVSLYVEANLLILLALELNQQQINFVSEPLINGDFWIMSLNITILNLSVGLHSHTNVEFINFENK